MKAKLRKESEKKYHNTAVSETWYAKWEAREEEREKLRKMNLLCD